MQESIILNGVEFLTRAGVEKEYLIKECSLYKLVRTKKIKSSTHPSFGVCFKREWLDEYFNDPKKSIKK